MTRLIRALPIGALALVAAPPCVAQGVTREPLRPLALGFAVDTTVVPGAWWGVDPAREALSEVVRTWRDFLAVRHDPARRIAFWSAADRARAPEPDPLFTAESYLLDGAPLLVEALPLVAGDASRWVLRTLYTGEGNAGAPGVLGIERSYVVRERARDGTTRWAIASPMPDETRGWRRTRIGRIEYVVHPSQRFDAARAAATSRWADELVKRFAIADSGTITYLQAPDLQAGLGALGIELALSADRVGGRASASARVVVAADPRYAEGYRHELVHVLLAPIVDAQSYVVTEGIAYWLGGARGRDFDGMMRELARFLAAHPGVTLARILAPDADPTAESARLAAAGAIFELAYRRGGDPAVRRLVEQLPTDNVTSDAVARVLGLTGDRLEREWRLVVDGRKSSGLPP